LAVPDRGRADVRDTRAGTLYLRGASNRITDLLFGVQYTCGAAKLYADYSLGFDANPAATHEIIQAGTSIQLTKYLTFYLEYVHEKVKGHAVAGDIKFFEGVEFVIYWSF